MYLSQVNKDAGENWNTEIETKENQKLQTQIDLEQQINEEHNPQIAVHVSLPLRQKKISSLPLHCGLLPLTLTVDLKSWTFSLTLFYNQKQIIMFFVLLHFFGFSRQGFSFQPCLSWNLVYRSDWPRIQRDLPSSLPSAGIKGCYRPGVLTDSFNPSIQEQGLGVEEYSYKSEVSLVYIVNSQTVRARQ